MQLNAMAVFRLARKRNYSDHKIDWRNNILIFKNVFKRGCGGRENQWGPVEIKVNLVSQHVSAAMNHHKLGKCVYERRIEDLKKLDKVFINPRTRRVPYKIEKESNLDPAPLSTSSSGPISTIVSRSSTITSANSSQTAEASAASNAASSQASNTRESTAGASSTSTITSKTATSSPVTFSTASNTTTASNTASSQANNTGESPSGATYTSSITPKTATSSALTSATASNTSTASNTASSQANISRATAVAAASTTPTTSKASDISPTTSNAANLVTNIPRASAVATPIPPTTSINASITNISGASTSLMPPTEQLLSQAQQLLNLSSDNKGSLQGQLVQLPNGQLQVQPQKPVTANRIADVMNVLPSSNQTNNNLVNMPSTVHQTNSTHWPTIPGSGTTIKKVSSIYDIGSNTVSVNSAGQFVVMGPNPTAVANLIASIQGGGEIEIRNQGGKNVLILYAMN